MDNAKLKGRMSGKVQNLQNPSEATETAPETSLTPANSNYLALSNNVLDIIRANLKSQPLTLDIFDIVKSPSGGSTVFEVPGLAGNEAEKELSDDGKACAHCPFNDFGSKDGESIAKACKESVLLFLLRPQTIIPLLIRVPVTSKPRFLKYSTRLLSTLTPISSVVTKITLEKATSKHSKPYALFNFEAVGMLSSEEAAQAKAFGQQFMEIVNASQLVPELAEAG